MNTDFFIITLIVVATPGTGALFTIATGLSEGRRKSLVAAFGCTLGILPHMAAAITGLAAILHGSALAFNLVKTCGVAYLIYMAVGLIRSKQAAPTDSLKPLTSDAAIIRRAILINLLNPKLSLFFLAFMPQFINPEGSNALAQMMTASLIFIAVTFAVFAVYGLFASSLRNQVIARPHIMTRVNRVFGLAFLAMAARLALTER